MNENVESHGKVNLSNNIEILTDNDNQETNAKLAEFVGNSFVAEEIDLPLEQEKAIPLEQETICHLVEYEETM